MTHNTSVIIVPNDIAGDRVLTVALKQMVLIAGTLKVVQPHRAAAWPIGCRRHSCSMCKTSEQRMNYKVITVTEEIMYTAGIVIVTVIETISYFESAHVFIIITLLI